MTTLFPRSHSSKTAPGIPTGTTPLTVTGPTSSGYPPPVAGRSLVVLDPNAPSTTLRAALQHPAVSEGEVHLLVVFPTAEYEARRRARIQAGVTAPYTIDHLETEAQRIAQRTGREWLAPAGIAFQPIGAVGRLRDCVWTAAEDREYTHVYVPATRRTLRQRLLGVGDNPSALAGTLPTVITVVPVDGLLPSAENDAAGVA